MKKLFGSIISGIGLLIAGTSGLCSLALLGMGASEGVAGIGHALMAVLIVGIVPFGFGVGIVLAGREIVRQANLEVEKEKARKAQEPRDVQSRSDVSK